MQTRRRRITNPSPLARESITLVSAAWQKGHSTSSSPFGHFLELLPVDQADSLVLFNQLGDFGIGEDAAVLVARDGALLVIARSSSSSTPQWMIIWLTPGGRSLMVLT